MPQQIGVAAGELSPAALGMVRQVGLRPPVATRLMEVTTVPLVEKNFSTILRVAASITPAATSLAVASSNAVRSHSVLGLTGPSGRRVDLGQPQLEAAREQQWGERAPRGGSQSGAAGFWPECHLDSAGVGHQKPCSICLVFPTKGSSDLARRLQRVWSRISLRSLGGS
jgi:hypothetical protein